jgi:predicted nucleotidyltransferase
MTLSHLTCACAAAAVVTAFVAGAADTQEKGPFGSTLRPVQVVKYEDKEPAKAAPPADGPHRPAANTTVKLRPDQRRAVELSIAGMEPSMRPFMFEQMAKNYASYDEATMKKLIKALEATASPEQLAAADKAMKDDGPITGALSDGDFAYNRAQYEPVIRKHWDAKKKFDVLVAKKRETLCPNRDTVARFGSAWRYELIELSINYTAASQNPDSDVAVLGSTYAPQDGRYNFDFSKVRMTFDEKAVEAAIKEGCDAYKAEGVKFLAKIDPMIARQDWEGAHRAEQAAMGPVSTIIERMNGKLAQLSPDAGYPLMSALQNGKRIKS